MSILNSNYGIVDDYTIVLSTRDYRHLGQISGIQTESINVVRNLNSAHEISFQVYKADMIKECNFLTDVEYKNYQLVKNYIWNNLVDFKLIWVKELNTYFSITVSTDDSADTIKTVTGTSLCESELSNYLIDSLEVNNEEEAELYVIKEENDGTEYEYTVFYNEEKESFSLLHRILKDKAPHYTIKHVDDSLRNEVRSFSVDGTDIYTFLTGEVSEQFNCLFVFDSTERGIYVYDLYTVCQNPECSHFLENGSHYRDDYNNFLVDDSDIPRCPICGSKNVKYFGEDTTILVDKNNLTDSISLTVNADEIKNCLKLVAGDDLMTSVVQTLNPNGTNYLYYISEFQRQDMPEELVQAIDEYNKKCEDYNNDEENGYQKWVLEYYNTIDHLLYLESSMMPDIEVGGVTAETEAAKLTSENLNPIALTSISKITPVETVNSALKQYAKIHVKTGYVKLEVNDGATFEYIGIDESTGYNTGKWRGSFTVTSYADEEDVYKSDTIEVIVTDDYLTFAQQKVMKVLNNEKAEEEGDLYDVLSITRDDKDEELKAFKDALKYYCYNRIESFKDALQSALDSLNVLGIGTVASSTDSTITDNSEDTSTDTSGADNSEDTSGADNSEDTSTDNSEDASSTDSAVSTNSTLTACYNDLYLPYYNKMKACEDAMNAIQTGKYPATDEYPDGEIYSYKYNDETYYRGIDDLEALQEEAENKMNAIHDELNFRTCIGEDMYKIYCAYRREDVYSNENYISDGLESDNVSLIEKAQEFLEVAKKELRRTAEPEYTISSTLKNLLLMEEFKPIIDWFKLGNWIRVKIDGQLYRLRLISYSINFGSLQDISVEFSTVTKEKGVAYDVQQIIKSAQSMTSSFGYVKKQAKKGDDAQNSLSQIKQEGLNSGLVKIQNNDKEEVTYGKHGLLCRSYDDITGTYSQEQMKITHNILAFTSDGWQSVRQLIGNHEYLKYNEESNVWEWNIGYGNTADFITSGHITGSTIVGGLIMSKNFKLNNKTNNYKDDRYNCDGSFLDLDDGCFSFGGKLTWDGANLKIDDTTIKGSLEQVKVTAENLKVRAENIDVSNGTIVPAQINCSELSKAISGTIEPLASNISGTISSSQVDASGFTINTSQLNGTIDASNISGTVATSKIADTLNGKTLKNPTLTGTVTTTHSSTDYTGLTKNVTIGTTTLKFVNGLLVDVTESTS